MSVEPADLPTDAAVRAVRVGDVQTLARLLSEHPSLVNERVGRDGCEEGSRTLLHVAAVWPGHVPNGAVTVSLLVAAGADVNARVNGPVAETALHWAASSDDVDVLDALLDAGADIDASGAVIAGGTPLQDATAFGQWRAAGRLVERGALTTSFDAAALGLVDRLKAEFADPAQPTGEQLSDAFWAACHGGQHAAAEYLLGLGAELDWVPGWEELTPLDVAARSGATDVIAWLHAHGAKTASALRAAR